MWADALFLAERNHVLRLLVWGAASVLAGTLLLLVTVRAHRSSLLSAFAIATALVGAVVLAGAGVSWAGLAFRDLEGFTRLDRALWFIAGLSLGAMVSGITLAAEAWRAGRRDRGMGAGMAVAVQGLAIALLQLHLIGILRQLSV